MSKKIVLSTDKVFFSDLVCITSFWWSFLPSFWIEGMQWMWMLREQKMFSRTSGYCNWPVTLLIDQLLKSGLSRWIFTNLRFGWNAWLFMWIMVCVPSEIFIFEGVIIVIRSWLAANPVRSLKESREKWMLIDLTIIRELFSNKAGQASAILILSVIWKEKRNLKLRTIVWAIAYCEFFKERGLNEADIWGNNLFYFIVYFFVRFQPILRASRGCIYIFSRDISRHCLNSKIVVPHFSFSQFLFLLNKLKFLNAIP